MKSPGFTLVELAIVMTIIGLLIGGILKGQELLENARVTATIAQIKSYDAALIVFEDIYNSLPGDITNPSQRIPGCATDPCSRPGNGDGLLWLSMGASAYGGGSITVDTHTEIFTFWLHLAAANLINGVNANTNVTGVISYGVQLPAAKLGGGFNISTVGWGVPSNLQDPYQGTVLILTSSQPGRWGSLTGGFNVLQTYNIDRKLDDGKPTKGVIRNYTMSGCGTADRLNYALNPAGSDGTGPCNALMIRLRN